MLTKTDRPKKALPLKLWLALEDDVQRHKAEIAAQFAQARARLLPAAHSLPMCLRWECDDHMVKVTLNADGSPNMYIEYKRGWESWLAGLQDQAAVGFRYPRTGAVIWPGGLGAYDAYGARQGLFGLGFLGL